MTAITATVAAAATHCRTCGAAREEWNEGDRLYDPTSPECPTCVRAVIAADTAAARAEDML